MRMSTGLSCGLAGLEAGGVFERVGGDDAVVGVGGGDQDGREVGAFDQVVIRRDSVKGEEFGEVFGRAVVGFPGFADGELVEPEHIHDADGREGDAEEVGALVDASTDEESAVRAALDGEARRLGVVRCQRAILRRR